MVYVDFHKKKHRDRHWQRYGFYFGQFGDFQNGLAQFSDSYNMHIYSPGDRDYCHKINGSGKTTYYSNSLMTI